MPRRLPTDEELEWMKEYIRIVNETDRWNFWFDRLATWFFWFIIFIVFYCTYIKKGE